MVYVTSEGGGGLLHAVTSQPALLSQYLIQAHEGLNTPRCSPVVHTHTLSHPTPLHSSLHCFSESSM